MAVDTDAMLTRVFAFEGGYVNNPNDKAGATNFGIVQSTLSAWRVSQGLPPATVADVQNLTIDEAKQIYLANYWTGPGFDKLPDLISPQCFDIGVNCGPGTAVKMMQKVVNEAGFGPIAEDGGLGPITYAAVANAVNQMGVYFNNALVEERVAYYKNIVSSDSSQNIFLQGWVSRAESFLLPVPSTN